MGSKPSQPQPTDPDVLRYGFYTVLGGASAIVVVACVSVTVYGAATLFVNGSKKLVSLLPEKITLYERKEHTKVVRCIGSVDSTMTDAVYETVRAAEQNKCPMLDVVIHSNGGSSKRCKDICRVLLRFPGKTRVWIPSYAASAGCEIAIMLLRKGPVYVRKGTRISPVDSQINGYSTLETDRVLSVAKERAPPTLIAASVAFETIKELDSATIKTALVDAKVEEGKIGGILERLVSGKFDHCNTTFDDQEMINMGLPVICTEEFPAAILSLGDWKLASASTSM